MLFLGKLVGCFNFYGRKESLLYNISDSKGGFLAHFIKDSQKVEHVLVDRLAQFISVDLQDAKARERFASLKKSTRGEIVAELEEDLHNSKSAFEKSRFNLAHALMNIETKKKYEFLESFSAIMDAHLRYFKLGYDLLSQLEPFVHQVLTCVLQSKKLANIEQDKLAKRIQEFRTQTELDHLITSSNVGASTSTVCSNGVGMSSYKDIEAIMQSTAREGVETIKQGYLLKRSSSLRAGWKRRFFILDSQGNLYYHRQNRSTTMGLPSLHSSSSADQYSHVFARFRSRHQRSSSLGEENSSCCMVDLRTSTVKIDAEDGDLLLCFRIISPAKSYTLQAENEADRIDWMNKITGVIAYLLNSQLKQTHFGRDDIDNNNASTDVPFDVQPLNESKPGVTKADQVGRVSRILQEIPGNGLCAECSALQPDWASLNLGILICIECSGVHRNLGVHISKIRSITLDVKVWEPTIMDLFCSLGNAYCNSIWEELLFHSDMEKLPNDLSSAKKPGAKDAIGLKEKYIHAKRCACINQRWLGPKCIGKGDGDGCNN